MAEDVPLRCVCGTVRGVVRNVSPSTGIRVSCMCIDCQTYAHHLGRGEEILDEGGGTDILQLTPSQIEITDGTDQIACVRQSPKGAMRWHTRCCKTPLGNTLPRPGVPFVGMPHLIMDHDAHGRSRDDVLGPIRAHIQAREATGPTPPGSHDKMSKKLIAQSAGFLFRSWLTGKARPSPFFDVDGRPVVEPTILSKEERSKLRERALLGRAGSTS